MRGLVAGDVVLDASAVEALDTCIQCRGCETACPSDVPFGSMIATARAATAVSTRPRRWRSRLLARLSLLLAMPRIVRSASLAAAVGQRLHVVPSRRLGLPDRLPLRRPPIRATGDDAWLFTGCVMDAWQRDVHLDVIAVATAAGDGLALPGPGGGCCGALAAHAGFDAEARRRAEAVVASMPGDAPIVVDSAGCGAMMKEYGHLLGSDDSHAFAARVVDVGEWLAERLDALPPARPSAGRHRVALQDPCHLRHVQRVHQSTRTVLAPYADLVELDDEGLCCGAGGAFSVSHPDLAAAVGARKIDAIGRSGAGIVASANPGCSVHLSRSGLDVRHPVSIIAEAIGARAGRGR